MLKYICIVYYVLTLWYIN